jgi:hypothetical protein
MVGRLVALEAKTFFSTQLEAATWNHDNVKIVTDSLVPCHAPVWHLKVFLMSGIRFMLVLGVAQYRDWPCVAHLGVSPPAAKGSLICTSDDQR